MFFPPILFYMKASCELLPSRIQRDSSECNWSKNDRLCSLRPPPTDAIFIILIALLTTILSLPILLFLNYLLNGYASNYPGSRGLHDEVGEGGERASTSPSMRSSSQNTTTAEILRNSTSSSAFGAELKKGLPAGDIVDYRSINITSQNSYAGKRKQSSDINSLLSTVISESYRRSLPSNIHTPLIAFPDSINTVSNEISRISLFSTRLDFEI